MRTLFLALRLEWNNRSQFIIHASILIFVIYFTLQYYGGYHAVITDVATTQENSLIITNLNLVQENDISAISQIPGFVNATLYYPDAFYYDDMPWSVASFIGEYSQSIQLNGRLFNQEDIDLAANVIVIPYSYALSNGYEIGEQIQVSENSYEIIGTVGDGLNWQFFVPYTTLLRDFPPQSITLISDSAQTSVEVVVERIRELDSFSSTEIYHESIDQAFAMILQTRRVESLLYFLFGAMSLVFVYSYVLTQRWKRLTIYSLNGASRLNVMTILIINSVVIFNIGFFGAYGVGRFMNTFIFYRIYGFDTFAIQMNDLFFFYMITLFIYLAVLIVYFMKFRKTSAIGSYRRSE